MKSDMIKQLLDRYFEGNSSLKEEQQLRRYFTEGPVAPELIAYQAIFQVLQAEQEIKLPSDFESNFMKLIETPESETKIRSIALRRPIRLWISRAAAIIILVLGLAWVLQPLNEPTETASIDWSQYEPEDPEEAIEYYKQAMLKLGAALNNGASTAGTNIKHVEEMGQFFK